MRSLQGVQRAGTCSEVPHAAGAPIAFAPEQFSGEREGHIGGKSLKVNLTACNQANQTRAYAPIRSAPTRSAISIRTHRRSIARTAFTMASAMHVHPSRKVRRPATRALATSVGERTAPRNDAHPLGEMHSPTVPLRVVSRLKLVHRLAP